ncbi:orotidine-5'-phosphate decarboxylase [Sneathiella glossodoripedis]|uniref:orotidine-5'-phosphate decarboxylase n=1 Tax=Sneathiella glossodoripedis TaxID=418853 RepID=UPI000471ED88|nr:orotidine-5'-phosphate decarboxylase [Sneathiella glossodoripedis]
MTRLNPKNPILTAIDKNNLSEAENLVSEVGAASGGIKLGKEFFTSFGPQGIQQVAGTQTPLFLDLKFHDIPNTVAGAVRAATRALAPNMMTIHASGGAAMIRAASDAASEFESSPWILAVTVLTSMDDSDLTSVGVNSTASDQVLRLARLAQENGADGVICSPHEITTLRAECGPDFKLVVPGIRPTGSDHGDQKRVKTPAEAVADGADYLVIGRPITAHEAPATAIQNILESLN